MHSSVKGFCKKARKLRYKTKKCLQRQGNDIIRIFIQASPTTVFKEDKITRNRVVGIVLCGEVKRYSL